MWSEDLVVQVYSGKCSEQAQRKGGRRSHCSGAVDTCS